MNHQEPVDDMIQLTNLRLASPLFLSARTIVSIDRLGAETATGIERPECTVVWTNRCFLVRELVQEVRERQLAARGIKPEGAQP